MKKIIIIFVITMTILTFQKPIFATSNMLELDEFIDEAKKYGGEIFPEFQNDNIIEEFCSGNINISAENILARLLSIIAKELKSNIHIIIKIIGLSIFCRYTKEYTKFVWK